MKTILLLLGTCIALANARQYTIESLKNPSLSQQTLAQLNQVQKSIDLSRDTLSEEQWLEVEKNEIVKICLDKQIPVWETSLNAAIYNDSCLVFQAPTLIGVDSLKAFFRKDGGSHKINLAVGMKYLNFKKEEVLLGYDEFSWFRENEDPERLVSVTGTYLVDKYPVTNCEFMQLMWDSIPEKTTYINHPSRERIHAEWLARKKAGLRNGICPAHDTAAGDITLYQAINYANARSIREGLKPYYIFSKTKEYKNQILSNGSYVILHMDFSRPKDDFIQVSADKNSDGYRLPYYDEWMMLARGGDKKNKAPWGDTSATFEDALKYARFTKKAPTEETFFSSEPVGQLLPNGYGLYDIFGLVRERIFMKRIISKNLGYPSCFKGGGYRISFKEEKGNNFIRPYWGQFNYGYFHIGYGGVPSGFRLIRNIGNNVKWKELETEAEQ